MITIEQHDWLRKINSASGLETPYMLTDVAHIRRQCQLFKESFPDVKLYYAVKCFSHERVLRTVDPLVDGYDAASAAEIQTLVAIGVDPLRINYSNPIKSEPSIRTAVRLGVRSFAFQSKGELDKIARCTSTADVYVRVRMGDAHGAQNFSSKFGCDPDHAISMLTYAQTLGLNPMGITFHVGSQATEVAAWKRAIKDAQALADDACKNGITLTMINMGGGFPAVYDIDDPRIVTIAIAVNSAIADGPANIAYIAEPGRFVVADSSVIVATVISREDRANKPWLFLDVGAFQAFFEIFEFDRFMYPVQSRTHLAAKVANQPLISYALSGPTCDSFDTMTMDVQLPAGIQEGDQLIISKTGAYTIAYGSNFNGFTIPRPHFIDSEGDML